jgi:lipopolysaccharide/colanic/teichoic acid biosynthesis glycosyltransferase
MHFGYEEGTALVSERADRRLTSLGRFMRQYKFYENLNFFNVLKGEMPIIGPRPEQLFYIDQIVRIEPYYMQLRQIKPGITSWGQVKYGYASDVEEMIKRMEFELFYLKGEFKKS